MTILRILLVTAIISSATLNAQQRPPAGVVVKKIVSQKVDHPLSFIGTLYYERVSRVSSQVAGQVKRVMVKEGDRISRGTAVAFLDTQILDKEILIQKNRVEQAALQISHTRSDFDRMTFLHKKNSVSKKQFDDTKFLFEEARLQKAAAQTLLEKLLIQKQKSVIRAPFDGIVLEKNSDSGDWVQPGTVVIELGSVNDLAVKVPMAETVLKHITVGQQVKVVINAHSREITGVIDRLGTVADLRTKNVFLTVTIPMQALAVQNMSATVFIRAGKKQILSMIPRDAVVKFQGRDVVFAIMDGKAVMLDVNIVTYLNDMIGVDNTHFKDGMPVVVDGNERLQDQQPVTIVSGY